MPYFMKVGPKGVVVVVLSRLDGVCHGLALGQLCLREHAEDEVHVGGPGWAGQQQKAGADH